MSDRNQTPLAGVRVLDLSRLVAGNMVSHLLADFGADVIKIERPGFGDDLRNWQEAGVEHFWKTYSRNKRSVCWDLKDREHRAKLLQLTATAQVLIENFVPGKLEELGLGPDSLWQASPKLIIVRVSGWGQSGPYRDRPGFGTLIEAMSGYAHLNGFPDKPPALPPLATADMIAGLYGAFGVMAALRHVEIQDGPGQVIDCSLFDSMFSFVASEAIKYQISGEVSIRSGNQSMHTAPRNVYRCQDGKFLALSASMQTMCERLLMAIGRPELVQDPRFRTNADRVRHRDELDQIIQTFIETRTLAENLAFFEAAQITVGPVLAMDELLRHPYVAGRQVLTDFADPDLDTISAHTPIPRLSFTPGQLRSPAPALGAHTAEIEAELNPGSDHAPS